MKRRKLALVLCVLASNAASPAEPDIDSRPSHLPAATDASTDAQPEVDAPPALTAPQSGAPREERLAVVASHWQPVVEFGEPRPYNTGNPNRFWESVRMGTALGAVPLISCAHSNCPPEVLAPALALVPIGAAAGAIVGIGRELVSRFEKTPPPPAGLDPADVAAAVPVIARLTAGALGPVALQSCVMKRLSAGAPEAGVMPGNDGHRLLVFSAAGEAGPAVPGESGLPARLSDDGYRYAIEPRVSRVLVIPHGQPGQRAEDVPAAITIDADFTFTDLAGGKSQRQPLYASVAPRPLREWMAAEGAALSEALATSCADLAESLFHSAPWRRRDP